MERQHLVAALIGRVSPVVVDAYVARALSRSAGCSIVILPSASDTTKPIRQTQSRRVSLPIKGTAGWMLAMADSSTQKVRILSSVESDGCIVIDGGRDRGSDGGIELLGWVTELITNGSVPQRGGDTLAVRLELTVMMQTAMQRKPEGPAPVVKLSQVVATDLSRNVCVSDDTIDFCFNRIQRRVGAKRLQLVKCGEVKAWAAARSVVAMETGDAARKMEEAYRSTIEELLRFSDITILPVHGGSHWCLVVVAKDAVHVLDSMGRTSTETQILETLRWLYPQLPDRVVRPDVARQQDGTSCGIFSIAFAEAIARDPQNWKIPKSLDVTETRRRLLNE